MTQYTILIAEDEIPIRHVIANHFVKEGFHVIEANNGKEGYTLAKEHKPHIILLDILMPVMDGISMMQALESDPDTERIPIIFLSNLSDGPKVDIAKTKSPGQFLVKANTDISDIVMKVKKKLGLVE